MSVADVAGPICRSLLMHGRCFGDASAQSAALPDSGRASSSAQPALGRARRCVRLLDSRHLVEAVVTVFVSHDGRDQCAPG
eukprot:1040073-Alexandrium_andersonii.AAC.1